MPVRVFPSVHGAKAIPGPFAKNAVEVLQQACRSVAPQKPAIIQTSLDEDNFPSALDPSNNGFVYSIISAYNQHHHLRLRPDDVWFAILTQFSAFVNAHAEELRDKFVEHEGQKELSITYGSGSRYTFDFGVFVREMTQLIQENVVDPELRAWILPDFSTTTRQDSVIASIIMMGTVQKYFTFKCSLACGIPSVTLLGEREDYQKISTRLGKLASFGPEPSAFAKLLQPVLSNMIRTFDDPSNPDVIDFWQKICGFESEFSGSSYYSGWVTAFCFWDEDGKRLYNLEGSDGNDGLLRLDGVAYAWIDSESVPPGWTKVPVTVDDNGERIETDMVAGSIGLSCSSSGTPNDGVVSLDTVQPETGWWIYERQPPAENRYDDWL